MSNNVNIRSQTMASVGLMYANGYLVYFQLCVYMNESVCKHTDSSTLKHLMGGNGESSGCHPLIEPTAAL